MSKDLTIIKKGIASPEKVLALAKEIEEQRLPDFIKMVEAANKLHEDSYVKAELVAKKRYAEWDKQQRKDGRPEKNLSAPDRLIPHNTLSDWRKLPEPEVIEAAFEDEKRPTMTQLIEKNVAQKAKEKEKEEANQVVRKEAEKKGEQVKRLPDRIKLINKDFRDVTLDKKANLIFTDPPYPLGFLHLYKDLSAWSKDNLADDGFLFVFCSHYKLPEYLNALSEHMTFVHLFCITRIPANIEQGTNTFVHWRPVACYSHKLQNTNQHDVFSCEATRGDKNLHEWQQGVPEMAHFINKFSKPGDLVCDTFLGSGTTAVACPADREFVGIELKKSTYNIAKGRVNDYVR